MYTCLIYSEWKREQYKHGTEKEMLWIFCFTFIKGFGKSSNCQTSQTGGGILQDNSLKSHDNKVLMSSD